MKLNEMEKELAEMKEENEKLYTALVDTSIK